MSVGAGTVARLYTSASEDEQHIQRFLSANGFGDHLTRTRNDVPMRELLTFSMVVSLGGCEPVWPRARSTLYESSALRELAPVSA
jgi:4-carboxymuconolactone decarboxylase